MGSKKANQSMDRHLIKKIIVKANPKTNYLEKYKAEFDRQSSEMDDHIKHSEESTLNINSVQRKNL